MLANYTLTAPRLQPHDGSNQTRCERTWNTYHTNIWARLPSDLDVNLNSLIPVHVSYEWVKKACWILLQIRQENIHLSFCGFQYRCMKNNWSQTQKLFRVFRVLIKLFRYDRCGSGTGSSDDSRYEILKGGTHVCLSDGITEVPGAMATTSPLRPPPGPPCDCPWPREIQFTIPFGMWISLEKIGIVNDD